VLTKKLAFTMASAFASIAVSLSVAAPAQAGTMIQGFGEGWDYKSSRDFIPNVSSFHIGGYSCPGGDATGFKVSLMKTSNRKILYTSPPRPADSSWSHWPVSTAYVNQAHYVRIYFVQANGIDPGTSLCSGASADW